MAERRPDRTLGPGHDTFWAGCVREELRLPRCTACQALCWPIEPTCPNCGERDFVWEQLTGRGTIVSWATFERDYYAGLLPLAWDTILVELEEGPLFISNPEGMSWRDLSPGLPVEVAFRDCEDSAGLFKLPVFRRSENDPPAVGS